VANAVVGINEVVAAEFPEVAAEVAHQCRQRKVPVKYALDRRSKRIIDATVALTVDERRRLLYYRALWKARFKRDSRQCRSAVFNLGQNPEGNLSWSAASGSIPCLSTKWEPMWLDSEARWPPPHPFVAPVNHTSCTKARIF